MHEDDIRRDLLQNRFQPVEDGRGDIEQRLSVLHNVQIVVRLNTENLQHLIQHPAVLGRNADNGPEGGTLSQFQDQGAHFDGFRPGAENKKYFFHQVIFSRFFFHRSPPGRSAGSARRV